MSIFLFGMAVVSYEEFFSIGRGHSLLGLDSSYTLFFTFAKFSEQCNREHVSGWIDVMSHAPVRPERGFNVSSGAMMRCNSGDARVKVAAILWTRESAHYGFRWADVDQEVKMMKGAT
ncbi:hypothetical protein [Paraburkholderia aspalathi]|uniref:hypothetical protein n=1 Tax=Paraburkholderia aspalathi TaxID=1324617 RepID=UPI00190C6A03|nr:hypothetical protein [Paraburkholderia aspalathi]MBK3818841.1 hypothetical protein [Paraburkholderia aspalathi]MBK3830688.1 hypothetical protein [Paraburkholderia aspalathi]MBK3860389.1 hypothetical protein [Paraburkholderia aspalathi]